MCVYMFLSNLFQSLSVSLMIKTVNKILEYRIVAWICFLLSELYYNTRLKNTKVNKLGVHRIFTCFFLSQIVLFFF